MKKLKNGFTNSSGTKIKNDSTILLLLLFVLDFHLFCYEDFYIFLYLLIHHPSIFTFAYTNYL